MKLLQLIGDMLWGLLALLALMALMPMPVSAHAVYPGQAGASRPQALQPASARPVMRGALQDLPAAGTARLAGAPDLAQETAYELAAAHVRSAPALANPGSCDSIASPVRCDSAIQSHSSPGWDTSYLPEPSPWFMLLIGLVGIVLLRREP